MIKQAVKRLSVAFAAWGLLSSGALAAESSFTLGDGSAAGFTATGKPGFLRINGEGGKPSGQLVLDGTARLVRGEIKVKLADLKTGIDLRDEHMKTKYLEVEKYPEAVFQADAVSFSGGAIPSDVKVPGKLSLHGVTKPVELEVASLKSSGDTLSGDIEFEIKLSDYNISIPSFMGVTVAETVKVHASFSAKRAGT